MSGESHSSSEENVSIKIDVKDASKDNEGISFTVASQFGDQEPGFNVRRHYDDLLWLRHQLNVKHLARGIIVPPLPPKQSLLPRDATEMTDHQGKKILPAENFDKHCREIAKFLRLVAVHPDLRKVKEFESFLQEKELVESTKIRKSLLNRVTSVVDKALQRDVKGDDPDLAQELHNNKVYGDAIETTVQTSREFNESYFKIGMAYGDLAANFRLSGVLPEELVSNFSEILEDVRHSFHVMLTNDDNTLISSLDFFSRYSKAEKEMLTRRLEIKADFEAAVKAVQKVKPPKQAQAEKTKKDAEEKYEECTANAKDEIRQYRLSRVRSLQTALVHFTDAQIRTARDLTALLSRSLNKIRQIECDE